MVASNDNSVQLSFSLKPLEPFGERYFVPHSGVGLALETLQRTMEQMKAGDLFFAPFYIYGPTGVGKTHLVNFISTQAVAQGSNAEFIDSFQTAGKFVDSYERVKRLGGMFLVSGQLSDNQAKEEFSSNPHVTSRLNTLTPIELNYPTEVELRPIIDSLAERHNLKLPETTMNYLLRHLPLKPLSFDNIFARINELSLADGKPAKRAVVKAAVLKETIDETLKKDKAEE